MRRRSHASCNLFVDSSHGQTPTLDHLFNKSGGWFAVRAVGWLLLLPFCASREVWSVQYRSNGSTVKKSSPAAHSAISRAIVTFRPFINQRDQLCNEHVQRISTSPTDIVYQVMALLCMFVAGGQQAHPAGMGLCLGSSDVHMGSRGTHVTCTAENKNTKRKMFRDDTVPKRRDFVVSRRINRVTTRCGSG